MKELNSFGDLKPHKYINTVSLAKIGETYRPEEYNYHFHFDVEDVNGYCLSYLNESYAGELISSQIVVNIDYLPFHLTMAAGCAMIYEDFLLANCEL